jgi:predicted DNA-binding ribbon-helix-helix protein
MRIKSPVIKRSIVLAGQKTSVSLEDAFWESFKDIAIKRGMSLSSLAGTIQAQRQQANLSSAIRLFVLEFYRSPIPRIEGYRELNEKSAQSPPLLS